MGNLVFWDEPYVFVVFGGTRYICKCGIIAFDAFVSLDRNGFELLNPMHNVYTR